jgi:preprotein translocase subunit SecE
VKSGAKLNSKIEQTKAEAASGGDIVKYVISALLVVAGLFVWFWFSAQDQAAVLGSWSTQIRALAVIVGLVAGGAVFMATAKGRETREFLSESRFELRKVVWPTRQEAVRTTWVVVVVVIVLSLLLGGFDFLIQKAVQWFLGR